MIQADIIAGLTVGVMAVPQSVSFAAMAGLPAAYGLYTAFIPVFAYSIIGSSRHLVQTIPPLCKHSTAMQQLIGVYMLLCYRDSSQSAAVSDSRLKVCCILDLL